MPSAKKVSWAQLKVGIVAMIALALLGLLLFMITGPGGLFRTYAKLYTYLSDSGGLVAGSKVSVNGIEAGSIVSVGFGQGTDPKRFVRVEMRVFSDFLPSIPEDSLAIVTSENVLSGRFVNIRKGARPVAVKDGAELKSREPQEWEAVVDSGNRLLNALDVMLKRVDNIVSEVERGKGSIGRLIYDEQLYTNLNTTVGEARKLIAQLNSGKGSISKLLYDESLVDELRVTVARTNRLIDGLEQGQGTMGKLLKDTALHDDMRNTVNEVRSLLADLNAGKGSAGKLLKDEALVKQVHATIARMDALLDGINSGKGTLGQLVVNQQLYESLNGTTREVQGFMKDFRANPKKFLSIKLGLF
jgi:phospholipid/cholesterol/gamma-HCH transport system substrate-binding protein